MLWLARDEKDDGGAVSITGAYAIFGTKPRKVGGHWVEYTLGGINIHPRTSPIKLKPGEGPVRVKLVKA